MRRKAFITKAISCVLGIISHATMASTETNLPEDLVLATTDWCPYACESSETGPGFVHEYIQGILKSTAVNTRIESFPWERAVKKAQAGKSYHGLLTAVPSEAPDLLFTKEPIMSYQVCFFTLADNSWQYNGVNSLNGLRLGAITGYSYDEVVDGYIAEKQQNNSPDIELISGNDSGSRLVKMLRHNRIDVFVEDKLVALYNIKYSANKEQLIKSAGCLASNPFYVAINPNLPWANNMISHLDTLLSNKENVSLLDTLIEKYTQ